MTPERWRQIETLLHAALERAPEERTPYLDAICAGDVTLQQEVESLLKAHEKALAFIESPAVDIAAQVMATGGILFPGQKIDHFTIVSPLDKGGMGVVYLADDTKLGRKVVLKLLPPAFTQDKERLRRFEQEARTTSNLNHPNIVTIYEVIESEIGYAIVMERIEGRTLREVAKEPLSLDSLVHWGRQVAEALAAAHAADIVHRDIKPANIMIRTDGHVKVLDFGLARLMRGKSAANEADALTLTNPSVVMGTPAYMSPEQARGQQVSHPTDIFSLGIIFYELATGQHPFPAHELFSTLDAIKSQSPQKPLQLNPSIPAELQRLILQMMAKDASLRPTAVEVEQVLTRLSQQMVMAAMGGKRQYSSFWRTSVATAILTLLAVTFLFRNNSTHTTPAMLTAVALTTDMGYEGYPSFSPDGNKVAYSWDEKEENEDIYIKDIGGGSPVRLTIDPAPDTSPAWSPDGQWIAFLRRSVENIAELKVFLTPAPLGGHERQVAQLQIALTPAIVPRITWTKDSRYLIVPEAGLAASTSLYLLSIATGEKWRLTSSLASMYGDSSPAISPDGSTLAFVRHIGGADTQLYVVPLSDNFRPAGSLRRLATEHRWLKDPAWTPDGRDLIYFAYTPPLVTGGKLWRVSASGLQPPIPVVIAGHIGDVPAVSMRSNRLAYRFSTFDYDIWQVDISDGMAGTPRRLITSTRPDQYPQYSPDGMRIAFTSARSGAQEIWICDADGSNQTQLTFLKDAARPVWSPDSRSIVFTSSKDGQVELYLIHLDKGSLHRLTNNEAIDVGPSVSRDGTWIYFSSTRSGTWQIWRMPVEGGEAVPLTRGGGSWPIESSDGNFIFYRSGISDLWKMSVEGGEPSRVFGAIRGNHNFAVGKDGIYFVGDDADRGLSLQFFRFATGIAREVISLENSLYSGVTVSPDGRSVLYSQRDKGGSDLVLVENFH